MAYWLVKSEPGEYSFSDLERDGRTEWTGVHNALALRHLKGMRPGDGLLFYHSGAERAVVGLARVVDEPRPDPADDRGSWKVGVRPDRRLPNPVPLAALRADPALAELPMLRMTRLSVGPVTPIQWRAILRQSGAKPPTVAASQGRNRGSRSNHRSAAPRNRGAT